MTPREIGSQQVRPNEQTKETKQLAPPPPAPNSAIYHGVLGDIVNTAAPTTEADPVGVYVSLLASASAVIGRSPYVQIGNTRHPLLIWALLFGRTGTGRKGEATDTADVFIRQAMVDVGDLFVTGLSSGEGLIERIRDPKDENDRGGTEDKRLRVLEPEFGSVLARAKRDGSTLGAVLREAWSGNALGLMNRSAITASWSHVAIIGHVTPREFRLKLAEAEMAGGTFNRFLPIYVEQSKRLPTPEGIDSSDLKLLSEDLRRSITNARRHKGVELGPAASKLWCDEVYDELGSTDEDDAAWTEFARRAAPYCRRIAALHAVLDDRSEVSEADLVAAAALTRYAVASARYVLDRTARDPKMDRLRRALDSAGADGLGRQEISALFSRNLSKDVLDCLLAELVASGEYEASRVAGLRGRPAERYCRVPQPSTNAS